ARDLDALIASVPEEPARGRDGAALPADAALDRRHEVRLVVERAGQPGHDGLRDELADEDDAAALPPPRVEAQGTLGEPREAGPGDAEDPRVDEVEGHEAGEGRPIASIELEPGG